MTTLDAEPWPRPPAGVDRWGTPEAEWLRPLASVQTMAWPPRPAAGNPEPRLVVLSPHPDDEALGVGGLMARCLAQGWRVLVVAVSDGEAAFRRSRPRLARRRQREQSSCHARLTAGGRGVVTTVRLGLPDGGIAAQERELEAHLTSVLRAADWCLTTCAWDGDPDHDATGRAAAAAAHATGAVLAEYPVWAWHWTTASSFPWHRARRIDLTAREQRMKVAAVAEHRSQLAATWRRPSPVVPPHVLIRFHRLFEVVFPMTPVEVGDFEQRGRHVSQHAATT
jgi:LmbE family N-acetylglucosaminyl deacetylase